MKNQAIASKRGTYEDWKNGDSAGKKFLFKIIRENSSTTVTKANGGLIRYVGMMGIPAFSRILEKDDKGILRDVIIRYDPFEQTIYKEPWKGQPGQSKDPQIIKNTFNIKILNGFRTIEADREPLLLEFMMKDEKNVSNPNRRAGAEGWYELVDFGKRIAEIEKNDDMLFEVRLFCKKADWDDVIKIARVISNTKGYALDLDQSPSEIRYGLDMIAKHNPMAFNDILKDPRSFRKSIVLEAIEEGILILEDREGTLAWRSSPDLPICTSPVKDKISTVDFFVNNSTSPKGEQQYGDIKESVAEKRNNSIIKKKKPENEEIIGGEKEKKKDPIITGVKETDEQIQIIVDKAFGMGLITLNEKKTWYTFVYDKDGAKLSFMPSQCCQKLRENEEIFKLLKTATGVE